MSGAGVVQEDLCVGVGVGVGAGVELEQVFTRARKRVGVYAGLSVGARLSFPDVNGISSTLFVAHTVGNGGSGGLVDDSLDLKTRDAPSILGGLPLRVVEVSRDRHHSMFHLMTRR